MRPEVGSTSRLTILRIVVFPPPEGPTNTHSSPWRTSRSKSSTAKAPSPYRLETPSKRIMPTSRSSTLSSVERGLPWGPRVDSVPLLASAQVPTCNWSCWLSQDRGAITSDLLHHVELSLIAVIVGFAIALPLGVAAWKLRALRTPLVAVTGGLYVVPSIALFALIQPLTGFFTITTAEVALVSYTLLILLRNTIAGLDAVPEDVREAARGMGYTALAELFRVDLPLALPSIVAGLRVATVTVVGLVTVTAFIGQGGLGQLIIEGFNESFYEPIVVALVLSVLLAGAADALFVGIQRVSVPWLRAKRASA